MTAVAYHTVVGIAFLRGQIGIGFFGIFICCFERVGEILTVYAVAACDRISDKLDPVRLVFGREKDILLIFLGYSL